MREKPIMARHQRMPTEEAGYTYAVVPTAIDRLLANEEESIYGPLASPGRRQPSANSGHPLPSRKMHRADSGADFDRRKDGTSVRSGYNQRICGEFEF